MTDPRPKEPRTNPAAGVKCDTYLYTKPVKLPLQHDDKRLADIAKCLGGVRVELDIALREPSSPELNKKLIQLRVSYKTLKKWVPENAPPPPPEDSRKLEGFFVARVAVLALDRLLPEVLKHHDLFAQFSAVLVTGASFTDASQPKTETAAESAPQATTEEADVSQDAGAVGNIIWQTRHFGDESIRTFDISLGGRIGIQPVLNLVAPVEDPEASDTDPPPAVTAVHQPAFAWTLVVQANRPFHGINSELGFFGKAGSTTLMSLPKAVDRGTGSFLAFPIDNGGERTAWLWESGIEFNMFDNRLEQIHAEKGSTTPQFQFLLAIRRDERFLGSVYDAYDRPTGRLVFRLGLDAIKVFDRRQFGETAKPFTFGFVVEHERSLASSGLRVPSATRFILRGDINLLKALGPSEPSNEDENEAGDPAPAAPQEWKVSSPGKGAEFEIDADAKEISVSLLQLKQEDMVITTEPPTSVTVTRTEVSVLKVLPCPDSAFELQLSDDKLVLTPLKWGQCSVTEAVFSVGGPK